MNAAQALLRYRMAMAVFVAGLVGSGVTAFPLLTELRLLAEWLGIAPGSVPETYQGVQFWIATVLSGLEQTYANYPWIAYGTDWLAFGHLVISFFFVAAWISPSESRQTLWCGIIACVSVIPLAMICGPIRGIPFYWRLIDCSFGLLGLIPLVYCLRLLRYLRSPQSA